VAASCDVSQVTRVWDKILDQTAQNEVRLSEPTVPVFTALRDAFLDSPWSIPATA